MLSNRTINLAVFSKFHLQCFESFEIHFHTKSSKLNC